MTIGAAKVFVALPGCGGDDNGGPADAHVDAHIDAPAGYATLDDCHYFGTKYLTYAYANYYNVYYYYHYTYTEAYGCPAYVYPLPGGLYCYPDVNDIAPGYSYFCYVSHDSYIDTYP